MGTPYFATSLIILILITLPKPLYAGKLDRTRQAVRKNSSNEGSGSGSSGSSSSSSSGLSLPPEILCLHPIGWFYCGPFWLIERSPDHDKPVDKGYFNSYPYKNHMDGYMIMVEPEELPDIEESTQNKPKKSKKLKYKPFKKPQEASYFSFRFKLEYLYDLEGLHLPRIGLYFDSSSRLGVETEWIAFLEPLPEPQKTDWLIIGNINIMVRFAQNQQIQFFSGLGTRIMHDRFGNNFGFNFTYGFNLFPKEPLAILMKINMGNLGKAFFLQGNGTIGAMTDRFEFYAGWEIILIYPVVYTGPIAGVRIWF